MDNHRAEFSTSPAVTLGILGGLALVIVTTLADRGQTIYRPYSILALSLTAMLAVSRSLTNRQRLFLFVTGFMLASLILYAYIVLWANPDALTIPLTGHLWRLGFLLGVGTLLGGSATLLTRGRAG